VKRLGLVQRLLWSVLLLSACSSPGPKPSATPTAVQAIERFQSLAGLPASPLELVETTFMINAPDGSLSVAIYRDQEGRKFSFEPVTNQVVELDARSLFSSVATDTSGSLTLEALRAKAEALLEATTPDFANRRRDLTYSENEKALYFFDWRGQPSPNHVNAPFAQVALSATGELIAYYNTLSVR
jgi:hypothetical protein